MLLGVAESHDDHGVARLQLVRLGDEGGRGCVQTADDDIHVVRQGGDDLPSMAQHLRAVVEPPEEEAEAHHRTRLVQRELELRHHPEVAAAATHGPEQVRVLLGRGDARLAVCGHDADRQQVVDRQAELAAEPAHPTSERQATHARVAHQPGRGGQSERLGGGVHVAEQRATTHLDSAGVGIDLDVVDAAQVDHDRVVHDARTGHAVSAAADRDGMAVLGGEPDHRSYVGLVGAPGDQERAAVDAGVPDAPAVVVRRICSADHLAS